MRIKADDVVWFFIQILWSKNAVKIHMHIISDKLKILKKLLIKKRYKNITGFLALMCRKN